MKWILVLLLTLTVSERSFADCSDVISRPFGQDEWSWLDDDIKIKKALATNCPLTKTARCHYKENVTALNCAAYNGYPRAVEIYLSATPEERRMKDAGDALAFALENGELKVIDTLLKHIDIAPYIDSMFQKKRAQEVPEILMIAHLKQDGMFDKYSCNLSYNQITGLFRISDSLVYKFRNDSKLKDLNGRLDKIRIHDGYTQFQEGCRTKRNEKSGPVPNKSLSTK